jgi:hypothetical protein
MSDKHSTLTQSRLRELLRYDPASGLFSWWRMAPGRWKPIAGCINTGGYRVIRVDGELHYAHRLAWLYIYGQWPEEEIDHKDNDRSNNSLINLRAATHEINMQNALLPRVGRDHTRLPGAYLHTKSGLWRAAISINSKYQHIGNYETAEEASAAYIEAKRRLHPGRLIDRH